MKYYTGITDDQIVGGGSFVQEHGFGHEIFNYQSYSGHLYGYVQPVGKTIRIERLGALEQDASINDVLVVWVSRSPVGGVYIIGWYKNAIVYRNWQHAPRNSNRTHKNEELGFFVEAGEDDCTLLPLDKRIFQIPRGEGGMGQSNVWYADQKEHIGFKQSVTDYITQNKLPQDYKTKRTAQGKPWQTDPFKRQEVERAAVKLTINYYTHLGYSVDSVEKDNVGWDLEASLNERKLKLEVKGLSCEELIIELTPNEYVNMKKHKDSYRICVVTKALSKHASLSVFSFSPESGKWEDEQQRQLKLVEIISVRMNV